MERLLTLRVAVDFGTSSTCVVASVHGREPQIVVIDGQPLMPSAVYAAPDGTLFVGQEAERQAAVDPSRFEPIPKRRIDEGELLLGNSVLRVVDVVHAVLERAVSEARRLAGGAEVDLLVLTHPADWGAVRTRLLRQAAGQLAREVALVPEPVAAAVFHAATFAPVQVNQERTVEFSGQPGDTLAVLDLGGGTIDVSVVRRLEAERRGRFEVLATRGDPSFGGADIDQALLEHVGALVGTADREAWEELVTGRELADRRRRRVLRQDVRGAKETLSRHAYTDVPMPPPFRDAHVTREDLERIIAAPLSRAIDLTSATISDAGLRPQQLTAIFLVGGSSRIPMVSRLVHERTKVVPTTLDQPETVVSRGALRAVQVIPDRTGALPGTSQRRPVGPVGPGGPVGHGGPGGPAGTSDNQRTTVVSHPGRPPSGGGRPPPGALPTASPGTARRMAPAGPQQHSQPQAFPQPQHGPNRQTAPMLGDVAKPPGKRKMWWAAAGVAVLAAAVATTLVVVLGGPEGRTFAQYSYEFVAPPGWTQTGDNVADRQVVVKPENAADGDDLVVVQEFVLNYDGGAQRARLARELRQQLEADPKYGSFQENHQFADRETIHYTETKSSSRVNWYVVANGTAQVSVGCQEAHTPQRVRAACEQIVQTLEITN